jgi:peptidoglycan/xylan/chitin deacetylase (PgdA/CDA1 family)
VIVSRLAFTLVLALAVFAAACGDDERAGPTSPAATSPSVAAPAQTPAAESATVIRTGTETRRAVALTFDATADRGHTAAILAALRRGGTRASFAVTGVWAQENEELLHAIAADGHQIINQTYDYASFTGASSGGEPLSSQQRALELSRTETTVFRLTNRTTRPWFRPPYGDIDASVERDAATFGYPYIAMWSIDTMGTGGLTAAQVVERTLSLVTPGAVIRMDVRDYSQDAAALPEIIESLQNDGYAFETMERIIQP